MTGKGLRLYALANHLIATFSEKEDGDAAAAAAALFAVTAKSLGGGCVLANAREQVLRHHYSIMDRLREVSDRLKAGEALPGDPPPRRVIQQASRLKELSRELRQFSSQGLASITSPRTARQICSIFKLGDAAFADWEAQQRGRRRKAKGSTGKGRRAHLSSPRKSGKRKTPERQPRSASRLAPESIPVAAAAAVQYEVPLAQRRRSCEEEDCGLLPKQLFKGGDEGSPDSPPARSPQQDSQHGQQRQACNEWAAFKTFVSSPRRQPACGTEEQWTDTPEAAQLPLVEEQPPQQLQQRAMDVDGSPQGSPAIALALPAAEQQQVDLSQVAAGHTACSPADRAPVAPLSPKQGPFVGPQPEVTPEKLLAAPGLCSWSVEKENGSSPGSWAWDSPPAGPAACLGWLGPAVAAASIHRRRPPAAVRRGLLLLQSPATERAAAAREQMAAEAAEVLAADMLRLLSESDLLLSNGGAPAAGSSTSIEEGGSSSDRVELGTASGSSISKGGSLLGGAVGHRVTSPPSTHSAANACPVSNACSSDSRSIPEATQAAAGWQPNLLPPQSEAALRRTLVICGSNRLYGLDAAAAKAAAAAREVHAGGSLEMHMTRHNLNAAGRAHSIMRPIALPT